MSTLHGQLRLLQAVALAAVGNATRETAVNSLVPSSSVTNRRNLCSLALLLMISKSLIFCKKSSFPFFYFYNNKSVMVKTLLSYTGWPKEVSLYQESSLNCIKNRQCGYVFHQF